MLLRRVGTNQSKVPAGWPSDAKFEEVPGHIERWRASGYVWETDIVGFINRKRLRPPVREALPA
jgi:hypothetical protein